MISLQPEQVYNRRAHRHHLLERVPHNKMVDVVAQLGGLQAQVMSAAELQAWARVEDITPEDIRAALWKEHSLVKTWAWRGTLHLLAASEFPTYVSALGSSARYTSDAWQSYFGISADGMLQLMQCVRDALDGENLTREQLAGEVARRMKMPDLREKMTSGWGSLLKPSAFRGDLCFGLSQGQSVTFVRPDQWIGDFERIDPQDAKKELARRYLSTYGPASRDDFARWYGTTPPEGGRILTSIEDEIERVEVEGWKGWKGWALKSELKEIERLPAAPAVRLLPSFDPFVVARSHASIYAVPDYLVNRERIYRVAGWVTPVLIVGGKIEGIWTYEKQRSGVAVTLESFGRITDEVMASVQKEVDSLGRFFGSEAKLEIGRVSK